MSFYILIDRQLHAMSFWAFVDIFTLYITQNGLKRLIFHRNGMLIGCQHGNRVYMRVSSPIPIKSFGWRLQSTASQKTKFNAWTLITFRIFYYWLLYFDFNKNDCQLGKIGQNAQKFNEKCLLFNFQCIANWQLRKSARQMYTMWPVQRMQRSRSTFVTLVAKSSIMTFISTRCGNR